MTLPIALIVAPHPDDDVLACGGTIALGQNNDAEFHIVYMTDGRHSHSGVLGIWSDPSPQEVRDVRRAEAIAAEQVLGVSPRHLTFLDFEDSTLEHRIEDAIPSVVDLIERLQPTVVYYTLAVDAHRDHKATARIVEAAHGAVQSESELVGYLVWTSAGEPVPTSFARVEVDVETVLARKREAIAKHRSQVEMRYSAQTRPILSEEFVARFLQKSEVFYRRP